MRPYWRYLLLCTPFVVMAFLAAPFGQRLALFMPDALPLDDWDISQLTAYLQKTGVEVRMVPTAKDGPLDQSVFLTYTNQDWSYFNGLIKDAKHIHKWRGTVHCLRETSNVAANLAQQWGDQGLLIGPFVFYGDTELLARIHAALNRRASSVPP